MNTKESQAKVPATIAQSGVTVRVLLFATNENCLEIILDQRDHEPYKGQLGLPGGYIYQNESLDDAAKRIIAETTGFDSLYMEQLYTFGNPERDPNTWWVIVCYLALIPQDRYKKLLSAKRVNTVCVPTSQQVQLVYDHNDMVRYGITRLRNKLSYTNIAHGLLPEKFRLTDLQHLYEIILEHPLDKRNFRKKMLSLGLLEPVNEKVVIGRHRPAMLYKFKTRETVIFDT